MKKEDLNRIVNGHCELAYPLDVTIEVGGETYKIYGRMVFTIDVRDTVVTLLSAKSTRSNILVCKHAARNFQNAVKQLVLEGKAFNSMMRLNWGGPCFHWTLVEPK